MIKNRPLFNEAVARVWCKRHAHEHKDACGDVNATTLAEACANAFNVADAGGPLDDPDHWIWEVALVEDV